MENEIAPIGGADPADLQQRSMTLDSLTDEARVSETQASNFAKMVDGGLGAALSNPDSFSPGDTMRATIASPTGGAVGDEKEGMVSGIDRPGVENTAETSEQVHDNLIDRSRVLYTDLTVYNVAWSVAMRVQKDISQLLRGS